MFRSQVYKLGILTLLPVSIIGYNIDTTYPLIFSDPLRRISLNQESYFGYSVLLYTQNDANSSRIVIGAPKGNYSSNQRFDALVTHEPGVAYRCSLSQACEEIKPKMTMNEYNFITQISKVSVINKENGWFGAAMDYDKISGQLTVCAPRTILAIVSTLSTSRLNTMHGICYRGPSTNLLTEDRDLSHYNFMSNYWYNPLHGFSIHHARLNEFDTKKNLENPKEYRIIGRPKHMETGTVDIIYSDRRKAIDFSSKDEMTQFGYAVTSGYFFSNEKILYAGGAPGEKLTGEVGIIDIDNRPPIISKLSGESTGEYFGASLAACDFNNDGFDDLAVGSPHWGSDNGRVYIFYGDLTKFQYGRITLDGKVEDGQFGYSLACSDLDGDQLADIVVGAPWEGRGVIYIFNGNSRTDYKLEVSQRIAAEQVSPVLRRFGFSLSEPIDLDYNGFPELGVGAYKSGHAVLLRGKPVVKTDISVFIVPNILQIAATDEFMIQICVQHSGKKVEKNFDFDLTVTLDRDFGRVNERNLFLQYTDNEDLVNRTLICLNRTVSLVKHRNYIEPIDILIEHEFAIKNKSDEKFCEFCHIESGGIKSKTIRLSLPFNNGCGDDQICEYNLTLTSKFHGLQNDSSWIIGSKSVSLEVSVENDGEPAYLVFLTVLLPKKISLGSILPICQQEKINSDLTVTCEMGNPLQSGKKKTIILDLDMKYVDDKISSDTFNFPLGVKTPNGTKDYSASFAMKKNHSLTMNGISVEETYYFSIYDNEEQNVSFQHIYQTFKFGPTPISNAQFTMNIPVGLSSGKPFILVHSPEFYISGRECQCSVYDTELIDVESYVQLNAFSSSNSSTNLLETHKEYENITNEEKTNATTSLREHNLLTLQCSNSKVKCIKVVCNLVPIKGQDVGKFTLPLVLNIPQFKANIKESDEILKLKSEAQVELVNNQFGRKNISSLSSVNFKSVTSEITTSFYIQREAKFSTFWIFILAVLIGVLLFTVLTSALNYVGFFKRYKRLTMATMKNETINLTEDIDDSTSEAELSAFEAF